MDQEQLKNLSPQQKDELMRNVQAQVALANMQELLTVSKVDEIFCKPCFRSYIKFLHLFRK